MKPRVAIIGGGIAGLGCARLLCGQMNVTIFEKDDRLGGHANTVIVHEDERAIAIDTGFMVFNKTTYPNFYKLLCELDTPIEPTDMSFSVQHFPLELEWSGTGIKRALAKKSNLFNLKFLRMVSGVGKFNRMCTEILERWQHGDCTTKTVVQATKDAHIEPELLDLYILPMMSSLWSATPEVVSRFPIIQLAKFMHSHGLLSIYGKLDWFTITGGSKNYVTKMAENLSASIITNSRIENIKIESQIVTIKVNGENQQFSHCILACHADEALDLLPPNLSSEKQLLEKFKYSSNLATLHCDERVMPSHKNNWASWNYRIKDHDGKMCSSTHYWMNSLQNLQSKRNYFVTLDPNPEIDSKLIKTQIQYTHPIFTTESVQAQEQLRTLNQEQTNRIYFAGSYFGYGFHEDAYASAVELADMLLKKIAS